MIIPIIAAFTAAGGIIWDKIVLSAQKIGYRQLIIILFLLFFLICLVFYPFWGHIESRAFSGKYLGLLFLIIFIASIYNVLYYHGVEKEKIVQVELITMLTPLSTIVIASVFLQSERNWHIFFAGIIASFALIFSHMRRHHLSFDIFEKGLLIYLLLYPIEAILIKNLLYLYSPLALYLVRTLGVFIFLFIWFFWIRPIFVDEPMPSFSHLKLKHYLSCVGIAVLAVLQMVLTYTAYSSWGIVYTTIILILTPILVYFGGFFILKEKIKKRVVIAAIVILICIAYAYFSITG